MKTKGVHWVLGIVAVGILAVASTVASGDSQLTEDSKQASLGPKARNVSPADGKTVVIGDVVVCSSSDDYEPDDSPAESTGIPSGRVQSHTLHVNGDVDWLKVRLDNCEQLTVETSNLSGSNDDTVLELYDNRCQMIASDDDGGGGYASRLSWTASYSGVHLIKVRTYGGSYGRCNSQGGGQADCCYDIVVTVAPPVAPPPAPSNPYPADNATGVSTDTVLYWNGRMQYKSLTNPTSKLIYGQDDRLDEFEVTDDATLTIGDSTVALIALSDLTDNGDGTFSLPTEVFARYYRNGYGRPLCSDEPFRTQPNPAWCSGVLVADDIIATAGHCVSSTGDCAGVAFVFGFVMFNPRLPALTIDASEVYYCSEIIHSQANDSDWALIRLDRPVVGHRPVSVRTGDEVADDENLLVIGHPMGLPRKYAGGATVRDNSPAEYFQANLDTYGGNSGSGVFNQNTMQLEGILVRGQPDFMSDGPCDRSNLCSDTGCPGWEDVTRATEFSNRLTQYDVYFGEDPCDLGLLGTTTASTWAQLPPLELETTYYWRVDARSICDESEGDIWTLTTDATAGCFPSRYSTYPDWVALGKPDCWCGIYADPAWPYQCDGDAANDMHGRGYLVYSTDLIEMSNSWKAKIGDTFNVCADFDHKAHSRGYRVFTGDLGILVSNWKATVLPGDCPRSE